MDKFDERALEIWTAVCVELNVNNMRAVAAEYARRIRAAVLAEGATVPEGCTPTDAQMLHEVEAALKLIAETPTTLDGKYIMECGQVFQNIARAALAPERTESVAAQSEQSVQAPSGGQPQETASAAVPKMCSYDKKPCPRPMEGKGPGRSRCEQNGICQRVDMDTLPKLVIEPVPASPLLPGLEPVVDFYEREFYPLSNFSAFNLLWKGIRFDTSEAAYHWEKFAVDYTTQSAVHQSAIWNAPSAHEAFKYAEQHKGGRRPDWDTVKVDIMRNILRAKAEQHEYVRRKLLETGGRQLIEKSWRDDFWGWGPNHDGQNMLGKLWMEIRAEISRLKGEGGGS